MPSPASAERGSLRQFKPQVNMDGFTEPVHATWSPFTRRSNPMDTQKQLYLIDGSAYLYRAYHAIRSLSNATGFPTNAIFGFTRMLLKLMEERTPPYVGMFFDAKGPTFRHAVYADYKANRPPMPDDLAMQIPPVKAVTEAFRIPVIEMDGYEADDLIGTTARQAAAADDRAVAEARAFQSRRAPGPKPRLQELAQQPLHVEAGLDAAAQQE